MTLGFVRRWTTRSRRRLAARYLAVLAFALFGSIALERAGWMQPLEYLYYDSWHQFAGKRREAVQTAVVAVDDQTLLEFKDDPLAFWAPHFARAMEVLSQAGAQVIGLDFIYTVSAEAWLKKLALPDSEISRSYDAPLREQFARGEKVLISHLVENAQGDLELLVPPQDQVILLPHGAADTGVANLYPDSDKLVRHFYPVFVPGNPAGAGFATQLALRSARIEPDAAEWRLAGEPLPRTLALRAIGFVGPPGTVPTVSMAQLLQPGALQDPQVRALKARVVIIAANNTGTSDRHFTPYSRGLFGWTGEQMSGGEIHANIVETLISGRYPRPLHAGLGWLYAAAWFAVAGFFYLRLGTGKGAAVGIALGLACLAPGYAAFLADRVLPAGTIQAGLGLAFLASLALRLTGEERGRAHLKHLFGRYVSDEVVETLLSDADRPDMSGEERHVTVLFSDIRNFTSISELLQAHEVVEMLNAWFSRACEPILERGGMVNKYIGDAVMAVFGAPKYYPDHARRALAAGLDMVVQARAFQVWMDERFAGRGLPPFAIGVGLHTGSCIIGDIGSARRTEFTAIGDTVNAASRLEGVTKDLGAWLVASAATITAAGGGVVTGKRDTVHVKGRTEPIEVFEVLGLDLDYAAPQGKGRSI